VGAVVAFTAYVIAKHQATERQRRIAEERARVAYRRLVAQRQSEEHRTTQTSGGHKAKPARKVPRYIAVDTAKDEHTSPKAAKSVMIWDTQSQEIVGNNVYDIQSAPAVGSTAKFETYSAEYVGAGS
jgi:hypothetical protein